jgi:UPF0271 protein
MRKIDINVDSGESFGRYKLGDDERVLKYATSANIATGFHAGDPNVIWNTVKIAKKYGVRVGAHPGFQDIRGFGRRRIIMDPDELKADLIYQLGAIEGFLRVEGIKLQHVKLHGALYTMAEVDENYASAVIEAIEAYNPELIVITEKDTILYNRCKSKGIKVASEVFVDLNYNEQGKIIIERVKQAWDPNLVLKRALTAVVEGKIDNIKGQYIEVKADTLCIHGDAPNAADIIKTLREGLEKNGIIVTNLWELLGGEKK